MSDKSRSKDVLLNLKAVLITAIMGSTIASDNFLNAFMQMKKTMRMTMMWPMMHMMMKLILAPAHVT